MYASLPQPVRSRRPSVALLPALVFAALATACGGGGGGGGQSGIPGQEGTKETGESFIVDENQSGGGSNLHLAEVLWGRLVDVHQIDGTGQRVDPPVFEDFVIHPNVLTDNTRYVLDRNPVTQRERLVIQNVHGPDPGDPSPGEDEFLTLLAEAEALPVVAPKHDDGSASPPFTAVPRNACMVLRFDDCLDDDEPAGLVNLVRVFTGYPPITPFSARVIFDPNHGAMVGGRYHTTRVLVDMTVSQAEAAAPGAPLDPNAVGLPASQNSSPSANVSVRIPSQVDVGSGQPVVLTNLSGVSLDLDDNDPIDFGSLTLDVVRAVRSGNSSDQSNGFLRDLEKPRVVGGWPITITAATPDGAGDELDFLIGFTFDTTCLNTPAAGDVVTMGEIFLQVTAPGVLVGNVVSNLKVRAAAEPSSPQALLGEGLFHAPFQTALALAPGCWVSFLPEAITFPTTGIETRAQVLVRFSEPMDPGSLSPFGGASGGFRVVRGGGASSPAISSNIIVGDVLLADPDLTEFAFVPSLPYPHTLNSTTDVLHVEVSSLASDLAGNRLRNALPFVDFTIADLQATEENGAIVLRFESSDEYAPDGPDADPFADPPDSLPDLRGQFFFDDGKLVPRPVSFASWPVDQTIPVPARMIPVAGGVFTPLNPLGAKMQMLWRYCDLGWDACDETKHNMDVIGLSWSPFGGQVLADFYDQFEIQLGHSRFLPDEGGGPPPPFAPNSGLPTSAFEDNYLAGSNPAGRGGVVVHNRGLGYVINPANLFTATTGTLLIPFPFNQGQGQDVTYTWRDTAILAKGGGGDVNQVGIPLAIEANAGVIGSIPCPLDRFPANPLRSGDLAGNANVPSYGLPLLIEVRCHPSDQGLGFNLLGVAIGGIGGAVVPAFRAYSAGGINTLGNQEIVLPDAEPAPRGGFNPGSTPPGTRTRFAVDSVFYLGQLDTVVRVSRVHTVWLDAGQDVSPLWQPAVVEPSLAIQPTGTNILIDYRGASNFSGPGTQPFSSTRLDPYGNRIVDGDPAPTNVTDWSPNIGIGDTKRFLQVRLTFLSNIETRVVPELDALALPYLIQ
jgi:hypothetical protein